MIYVPNYHLKIGLYFAFGSLYDSFVVHPHSTIFRGSVERTTTSALWGRAKIAVTSDNIFEFVSLKLVDAINNKPSLSPWAKPQTFVKNMAWRGTKLMVIYVADI